MSWKTWKRATAKPRSLARLMQNPHGVSGNMQVAESPFPLDVADHAGFIGLPCPIGAGIQEHANPADALLAAVLPSVPVPIVEHEPGNGHHAVQRGCIKTALDKT